MHIQQFTTHVTKHILSSRELLFRIPAAPPCLVLGLSSYTVTCVYPFTRIYTHAYTAAIDVYDYPSTCCTTMPGARPKLLQRYMCPSYSN